MPSGVTMVAQLLSPENLREPVEASPALRATHLWLFGVAYDLALEAEVGDARALLLASVAADGATSVADTPSARSATGLGAAIEQALLGLAAQLGVACDPVGRTTDRRALFVAGAMLPRVTSVDDGRHGVTVTVKGAVEAVLPCCTQYLDDQERAIPLTLEARRRLRRAEGDYRGLGCTVVAVAHRAERDLVLIGLVALDDPDLVPWPTARALTTVPPIA